MTIEELRELFDALDSQGMQPRLCDTELIPDELPHATGDSLMACEDRRGGGIMLPADLIPMHPEITVTVNDDAMKDAGIDKEDTVKVVATTVFNESDIVLACVDGEYIYRSYYKDEQGREWLVPQNDKYEAILLTDKTDVRIIGRVCLIFKKAPKANIHAIQKKVADTIRKSALPQSVSDERVSAAIQGVAPIIEFARQWYGVMRKLVDKGVYKAKDYEPFCTRVAKEVPDHGHLPKPVEMGRSASLSFVKPVELWDPNDAPVRGKRFRDYQRAAEKTEELLEQAP